NRLCHGDFHPGNILMAEKGIVIIDWIDAACGNPLGDIARTSLLMEKARMPEGAPMRRVIDLMSLWFNRSYLRHCFQLFPWDRKEFRTWLVVNAAARLAEGVPEEQTLHAFVRRELAA
ncbi:MAG: phosphotransferase, partial [Anaerolineae bacterium]|nr:phosphotransferase [Anaerolineae bacterium]